MAIITNERTLIEKGVNTESWLCKVSVTTYEIVPISHTLRHTPVWAQVIQAVDLNGTGLLPLASRVHPALLDNGATPSVLSYVTGGNPAAGTGILYVTVTAPKAGPTVTTETVYFTLHLGRTHSRAR